MSDLPLFKTKQGEEIERLQQRVAELEQEREELATHVERLCEKITEYHSEDVAAEDALNDLAVIVADIPNQSLAERDAEVAKKAILKAKEAFVFVSNGNDDFQAGVDHCLDAYDKHLEQYANQLRKAGE